MSEGLRLHEVLPILMGLATAFFGLVQLALCWGAGFAWGRQRRGWAVALVGLAFLGFAMPFVLALVVGVGLL